MKRIDRVLNYSIKALRDWTLEDVKKTIGVTASEISGELDILRNNVSLELNNLYRQGKMIKVNGRPVHYIPREILEEILRRPLDKGPIEVNNISELIQQKPTNPFEKVIGYDNSLKSQIDKAKAAILYPPNGLCTLIIGETGVGKTMFANTMYEYAKYTNRIDKDLPMIIFNCADYYNNPQLLISHLFGHVEGAFTGADKEKSGLIEKANGSILFLDEIHRLPPEGQEMLFYFMDTGKYSKLGETERNRKAKVLIIGATTEEPSSALLNTFIRRIPIVIDLPTFEERPTKDKVELLKSLMGTEAYRINKPIKVDRKSVKALIGSSTYGNIGQLKSNIQLVCAKAFLDSIENPGPISIQFKNLPTDIKNGFYAITRNKYEDMDINELVNHEIMIMPEDFNLIRSGEDDYELDFDLYETIENKVNLLKKEGKDEEFIQEYIMTDIEFHLKNISRKVKADDLAKERVEKIVGKDVIQFAEEMGKIVRKELEHDYYERFTYAFALHLSTFLKKVQNDELLDYPDIKAIVEEQDIEYKIALKLKHEIEKKYNVVVPDMELSYLTLLLISIQEKTVKNRIGILVVCHGNGVATEMVNVSKKLLGEALIDSVDMPLEAKVSDTLEIVLGKVESLDEGKGVLLLVDMGSLLEFGNVIQEKTGTQVRTIDMVSTPMVLEAIRKSETPNMELDDAYDILLKFRGYEHNGIEDIAEIDSKPKAIITLCTSGRGAAIKLKQLVETTISNATNEIIEVFSISLINFSEEISKIQEYYNIVSVVGIKNPNIGVPFISLHDFIAENGEEELIKNIGVSDLNISKTSANTVPRQISQETLDEFLTYLNPKKVIGILNEFTNTLEEKLDYKFSSINRTQIMVHLGCALERMVLGEGLTYEKSGGFNQDILEKLGATVSIFEERLNIKLTEEEIYFIHDSIQDMINTQDIEKQEVYQTGDTVLN